MRKEKGKRRQHQRKAVKSKDQRERKEEQRKQRKAKKGRDAKSEENPGPKPRGIGTFFGSVSISVRFDGSGFHCSVHRFRFQGSRFGSFPSCNFPTVSAPEEPSQACFLPVGRMFTI